jgi:hypothetical protein
MTRVKTADLIGDQLNMACALAEGWRFDGHTWWAPSGASLSEVPQYAQSWPFGGPIVERERIIVHAVSARGDAWAAFQYKGYAVSGGGVDRWGVPQDANVAFDGVWNHQRGHTPLTAAMRTWVASKLGEEVELPDGPQTQRR